MSISLGQGFARSSCFVNLDVKLFEVMPHEAGTAMVGAEQSNPCCPEARGAPKPPSPAAQAFVHIIEDAVVDYAGQIGQFSHGFS